MDKVLKHSFNGTDYVLVLSTITEKPIHYVRQVRKQDDGSVVYAFLSSRQWKAESRVKSYFAKEIKAHMGW